MARSITVSIVGAFFAAVVAALAVADEQLPSQSRQTHQEWMASLGYQRHSGGWRTTQEIEILERNEKTDLAQKRWNKKLERLRQDLATGDATEAAEELAEITDRHAVPALTAALVSDPLRRVRLLYMESLFRIGTPAARAALVAAAVDHPDPETRIDAIDRLAKLDPQAAANALAAPLASLDNARINRAAAALGRLGVATVVPRLVGVLETRHVITVGDGPPEGSTTATFTPSGGAGLSMGSSRKQVAVPMKNEQVLAALVTLTGENFGWDLAAWRAWLARQRAPASIDLRRG